MPAPVLAKPNLSLDSLSAEHRLQLRCTMAAGAVMHDVERGVPVDSLGLTAETVERLTEALTATLELGYGADAETTRALLKADFEDYAVSFDQYTPKDENSPSDLFYDTAVKCESMWGGEIPLPPAPFFQGAQVDRHFCFALNQTFARATAQQAGADSDISMMFARRANRIETALLEQEGKDEMARQYVRDQLMEAADNFETKAFDALEEPEAETIMLWCEQVAGPDE